MSSKTFMYGWPLQSYYRRTDVQSLCMDGYYNPITGVQMYKVSVRMAITILFIAGVQTCKVSQRDDQGDEI